MFTLNVKVGVSTVATLYTRLHALYKEARQILTENWRTFMRDFS